MENQRAAPNRQAQTLLLLTLTQQLVHSSCCVAGGGGCGGINVWGSCHHGGIVLMDTQTPLRSVLPFIPQECSVLSEPQTLGLPLSLG